MTRRLEYPGRQWRGGQRASGTAPCGAAGVAAAGCPPQPLTETEPAPPTPRRPLLEPPPLAIAGEGVAGWYLPQGMIGTAGGSSWTTTTRGGWFEEVVGWRPRRLTVSRPTPTRPHSTTGKARAPTDGRLPQWRAAPSRPGRRAMQATTQTPSRRHPLPVAIGPTGVRGQWRPRPLAPRRRRAYSTAGGEG